MHQVYSDEIHVPKSLRLIILNGVNARGVLVHPSLFRSSKRKQDPQRTLEKLQIRADSRRFSQLHIPGLFPRAGQFCLSLQTNAFMKGLRNILRLLPNFLEASLLLASP